MMVTIGIDPGKSGGVAFANEEDGIYRAENLYPITALMEHVETIRDAGHKMQIVVEDVPPYTGKNIPGSSAFKLGVSFGLIQGYALGERIPCYMLKPKDWQKSIGGLKGAEGKTRKQLLRDVAKRLYPELTPTLKTCDAILITHVFLDKQGVFK